MIESQPSASLPVNRAERRGRGFRGPAYTHTTSDPRPRYVRRHIKRVVDHVFSGTGMPRRVRKEFARVERHAVRTDVKNA